MLGLALIIAVTLTSLSAKPESPETVLLKISPHVLAETAHGGATDFLIVLKEQADLSPAENLSAKEAKGRFVYDTLVAVARRTQAPLRTRLDALGISYESFYLVNMIAVKNGGLALVKELAARPEVARIEANPRIRAIAAEPNDASQAEVRWNLSQINADKVWALGFTGQNVTVAGNDTGVQWDHPALMKQYRGWNGTVADHNYNWHDAIEQTPEPSDPNGHGTLTLGVVVGDDGAGNQIGVAPGAQWMACRNMDAAGFGSPASYTECFQFFLAPYPVGGDPMTQGDPTKAPHVINNSWGCPPEEGCSADTLKAVIENVRAAGIFIVAAAGNDGPICSTVSDPPALYAGTFTVGATNQAGHITRFSSRGPVAIDGSNRLKPDVTAPGVAIRSSLPDNRYGSFNGTSLASPHVAGVVALLWSAAPGLIGNLEKTEQLIRESAVDKLSDECDAGGVPNNTYGWGLIDALAAVNTLLNASKPQRHLFVPLTRFAEE